MAVPSTIIVGSAALIAANPAAIVPIIGMYTVNAAVRIAYDTANYKISKDMSGVLTRIADNLESEGYSLAEIVQALESGGLQELNLHINNIPRDELQDYQESWSSYSE